MRRVFAASVGAEDETDDNADADPEHAYRPPAQTNVAGVVTERWHYLEGAMQARQGRCSSGSDRPFSGCDIDLPDLRRPRRGLREQRAESILLQPLVRAHGRAVQPALDLQHRNGVVARRARR
jgi:hypothetical protein